MHQIPHPHLPYTRFTQRCARAHTHTRARARAGAGGGSVTPMLTERLPSKHQRPQHRGWVAQWLDAAMALGWAGCGSCVWPTEAVPTGSHSTTAHPPTRCGQIKAKQPTVQEEMFGGSRGCAGDKGVRVGWGAAAHTGCSIWRQEAPRTVLSGLHQRTGR